MSTLVAKIFIGDNMSTPVLPEYTAPYKPVPQVTPFTIRDNDTMLRKVSYINKYIKNVLVPWVNENYSALGNKFEEEVNRLFELITLALEANDVQVDAKITELEALVNDTLQQVIADGIQVQDPVVAGIIKNRYKIVDAGQAAYGAIPGVDTLATAITAALEDVADGGKIVIPTGTYPVDAPVTVTVDKSVEIDFSGVTIQNNAGTGGSVLTFSGEFETTYSVTEITPVTIAAGDWGSSPINGVNLTLLAAPDWERGDLVKIVSDDALEGQRDAGTASENPASQSR
jgi:hypothetical protein